jgi:hypothetical protein
MEFSWEYYVKVIYPNAMLSLAIHHVVHLNKEQRYALHQGQEITVVGVSISTWVSENRVTSEPGKEVFCKYYLKNINREYPIQILQDGYEINLPRREGTVPPLNDDDWRRLNREDPAKLEAIYRKCQKQAKSLNLLDIVDGGSGCLHFREHDIIQREGERLNLIHFVSIFDMADLTENLV